MMIVAATLPLWCFTIAATRFENYFDSDALRIIISVVLVIVSVGLTLLAGKSVVVEVPGGTAALPAEAE